MKKKGLFIALLTLAALVTLLTVGSVIALLIHNTATTLRTGEYLDSYQEKAVAYLAADPEVIARFGEDAASQCTVTSTTYGFTPGLYNHVFLFRKAPETAEEFDGALEHITVTVLIGKIGIFANNITGAECEVSFERNDEGELVPVGYEWK